MIKKRKRPTTKHRVISIMIGLTDAEIKYLDRKIDPTKERLSSRSAILRHLVRHSMEHGVI